jgi:transcriptional regulator with XRE-family HTH domain
MARTPKRPLSHLLGQRIKQLRTGRRFSLRDLGARAGVSAAMISEVERGKKSPTVTLLTQIATALAVPTSYLFEHDEPIVGISVLRHKEHGVVDLAPGMVNVVLGHPISGSNLHFVRLELRSGAGKDAVSVHPAGAIERAHVAEGSVEVVVGDDKARLAAGDSCSFIADRPHFYRNTGKGIAKVYLVVEFASDPTT